jgi:hypothetical protein
MSDEKPNLNSQEGVEKWAKEVCQDLAQRLVKRDILRGKVRVEARWAAPGRILLGVAWDDDHPRDRYWVIGGEAMTPDVVPLKVADTPRDAARHFSLRWQMTGARVGKAGTDGKHAGLVDWAGLEDRFAEQAELLYEFTSKDEVWEGTQSERR